MKDFYFFSSLYFSFIQYNWSLPFNTTLIAKSKNIAFKSDVLTTILLFQPLSSITGVDDSSSLIIVSNNDQFKKIKNYVNSNEQKIISFEEIDTDSLLIQNILNEKNYKKEINNKLKRNMILIM